MIDVSDLIGKPFVWGARGPDSYDCFGVVLEVLRRFGCPWHRDFAYSPDDLRGMLEAFRSGAADWQPIPQSEARPGDLLLLSSHTYPHHVGIMIDRDAILHAAQRYGVCIQRPRTLEAIGYGRQEYLRWAG